MTVLISLTHPTFCLREKVSEICKTFLEAHGFNYFQYLRCYQDGSISVLVNDTSLLEYFMEIDFPCFSSYQEEHHLKQSYWFFWDEELPWLPVKIAREKSNYHHGLTFVRRFPTYYDMIAVALREQKPNAASYYMSRMKALEGFIRSFDLMGKDLLETVIKARILLPTENRDKNYQAMCLKKNMKIPVLGALGQTYVTPQELSCLNLKMQGLSHKEAAGLLCISPRTVETYLMRIKERSGVRSHGELLKMISLCP